jgi:3',5'-nucleoside bisphosphate phosphatase
MGNGIMPDFRADLHCHSCFSDGTDTPEELILHAIKIGLSGLSVTDHDTTGAYKRAFLAAREKNFLLLNGVEFSAVYKAEPIHILAYAYKLDSDALHQLCARHQRRREERNLRILENLRKCDISIETNEVEGIVKGSWGRPHIAYLLVKKKIVRSIQEAFDIYLAEGKKAYDPGESISIEETLDVIRKSRGKSILAHPHLIRRASTARAMLNMPFDGIECYYARFSLREEKKWIDLARQRGWIITGGSDYHGVTKAHNPLGASWVGQETFEYLYSHFLENNDVHSGGNSL